MMNKLDYKGFSARIDFSSEDEVFVGKVLDIGSLILFSATEVGGLKIELQIAVDEYLEHCRKRGIAPERPCKGTFNVRIGSDLHRQAATMARALHRSLNEFVREAVQSRVQECRQRASSHQEPMLLERITLPSDSASSLWSYASTASEAHRDESEDRSHVYN